VRCTANSFAGQFRFAASMVVAEHWFEALQSRVR